jgi:flagellar basal body-associated protein FliL
VLEIGQGERLSKLKLKITYHLEDHEDRQEITGRGWEIREYVVVDVHGD